jgi:hypothetical protein
MDKEAYFAGGLGDVDQQHVPATGNVLLGHEADPAISRIAPTCGRSVAVEDTHKPPRYRRNLWMSPWHENAAYLPP